MAVGSTAPPIGPALSGRIALRAARSAPPIDFGADETARPEEQQSLRNPRDFFQPMAIGAPEPLREIPVKPSRMIHFLDFSNEKMVAKAAGIA
jgi:hypothetical protein